MEIQVGYKGYRYKAQTGYDYSSKVSTQGKKGYFYYDTNYDYHTIELPDEMVEVAQQAALWYFTNYLYNKDNNSETYSETYNVKDLKLKLLCSNGTTNTDTDQWPVLEGDTFKQETNASNGDKAEVGKWKQEQAAILCEYLIDAADNYAKDTNNTATTGSPLSITPAKAEISKKTVNETDYYVVGPMKIENTRTAVYNLLNTITVNGSTSTGAYISDLNGNKQTDQTLGNYIGAIKQMVKLPP